jgi:hypothetical protein
MIIIAMIAAVAVPSMVGFIRHGQQVNRMNVARTLYLSMQNQLSRADIEGNLRSLLTEDFYVGDTDVLITDGRVAALLGANFPDEENEDYVFFISKPAGFVNDGGATLVGRFYNLLDEIIVNKDILDGAIMMEFNVKTGVVLSIFYGDNISRQNLFGYGAEGRNDVDGRRGMGADGYEFAHQRFQGYYGVTDTGFVQLPNMDIVRIFDGLDYTDASGNAGLPVTGEAANKTNILFAEFLLTELHDNADSPRDFEIYNDANGTTLLSANIPGANPAGFYNALNLSSLPTGSDAIYRDPVQVSVVEFGVTISLWRYIWVLDFIEGDILSAQPNNIGVKYPSIIASGPLNVRARAIDDNGMVINSPMFANTYFGTRMQNGSTYQINSVRHLNNIFYYPEGQFIQNADIYIDSLEGNVSTPPGYNFRPARLSGEGSYNALFGANEQYRIYNLIIDLEGLPPAVIASYPNVGLFSEVSGTDSSVTGVSLINANINAPASSNVGSIAGLLTGGLISRSNSYANVTGGSGNTGGLVGSITGEGLLSHSFNAGFYNTLTASGTLTENGVGSVMADGGNIGGLVGLNGGTIQFCYNNARVNVEDVELTDDEWEFSIEPEFIPDVDSGTALGGLVGRNIASGVINRSYATNFVAFYDNGAYSGGIAGFAENNGAGITDDTVYLVNGCNDIGNIEGHDRSVLKEDLMDINYSSLVTPLQPGAFISNADYRDSYLNDTGEFPKNVYDRYPYPVLANNMPYIPDFDEDGWIWGWEDIEGEIIIPQIRLVYYEFYNINPGDGRIRAEGYRDLVERTNIETGLRDIITNNTTNVLVTHDGYALEFSPAHYGYRVRLGQEGTANFLDFRLTGEDSVWTAKDSSDNDLPGWLPAHGFIHNVTGEDWFRLYIPNSVTEPFAINGSSNNIGITVYDNANVDLDPETMVNGPPEPINQPETYNPLLAPWDGFVRSARHLDNVRHNLSGNYIQLLNIDMPIYRRVLVYNPVMNTYAIDPTTVSALVYNDFAPDPRTSPVTGVFTGTYSGNACWIANLTVNSPSTDGVGLFSHNNGTIRQVTLRNPSITGGRNVGAIAGVNNGLIGSCSVQHDVTQAGNPPPYLAAEPMVRGTIANAGDNTTNVGGIAGLNAATISDVAVVSTSGTPAVRGTSDNATSIGGIVGRSTGGTVNNLMYLAVAPRSGTTAAPVLHPYAGIGTVGASRQFLSGNTAVRPFQTRVPPDPVRTYNFFPGTGANPADARNTLNLVRQPLFNAQWRVNTLADGPVVSQTNATFPYPFPVGTAAPQAIPAQGIYPWPIADTMLLTPRDAFVYYEKYADGSAGVFTRRLNNPDDTNSGYLEMDFLNPNGVIVEAGYAAYLDSNRTSGNFQMGVGFYSGGADGNWNQDNRWNLQNINGGSVRVGSAIHSTYPNLFAIPYAWLIPNAINHTFADPTKPVVMMVASGNGNNAVIGGAYLLNPLFAKDLYPVVWSGHTHNRTITTPPIATLNFQRHSIRTPWQMQQISRINAHNISTGNRFVQESDLSFSQVSLTGTLSLNNITGNGATTRSAGWPVNFTNTVDQNNGTTAVITTSTTSIVANNYAGIHATGFPFNGEYEGNGRTISNLTLSNTSNNKGLFNTIGTDGKVNDLTIINSVFQGGNYNGGFASVNEGEIKNVAFVSTAASPISATTAANAGGIVYQNTGTIENALYIARAPGDGSNIRPISATGGGTSSNSFYLSGTYSANNRPFESVSVTENHYNTLAALGGGFPRTTQELNALSRTSGTWTAVPPWNTNPWRSNANAPISSNTMLGVPGAYPYPYMGTVTPTGSLTAALPPGWPVATIPASGLAYFEIYDDSTVGFDSPDMPGLPPLIEDLAIREAGYCVIVNRAGSYSVKSSGTGANTHIRAESIPSNSYYYVKLPASFGGATGITEVWVNDRQIDALHRFINTNFAEGIYTDAAGAGDEKTHIIRTPQQMRNIVSAYPATSNGVPDDVTFILERDLDFYGMETTLRNPIYSYGAVVHVPFAGTFDGNGKMISNLSINSPNTTNAVGLFRENNGTIKNLTMFFDGDKDNQSQIQGRNQNTVVSPVGVIAGINGNDGVIEDITIVSSLRSGNVALAPVLGYRAGGVVGRNYDDGIIRRVIYLAPAPSRGGEIFPIANLNSNTSLDSSTLYYLSGNENMSIVNLSVPLNVTEYDYNFAEASLGTPINTGFVITGWTEWATAPGYNSYPYPHLSKDENSTPSSWPIVGGDVGLIGLMLLMDEINEELCAECGEYPCECADEPGTVETPCPECGNAPCRCTTVTPPCADCGKDPCECTTVTPPCADCGEDPCTCPPPPTPCADCDKYPCQCVNDPDPGDDGDSGEPPAGGGDEGLSSDEAILIGGAMTFFGGGYGITHTRLFKKYMQQSNARTIRRINAQYERMNGKKK